MTISEHFEQIHAWLEDNAIKFKGMQAVFAIELSGEDGSIYWLEVDQGRFRWGEGEVENAACTVSLSAADFKQLASGRMSPAMAFMAGRVRLRGDISKAMRFGSLLA